MDANKHNAVKLSFHENGASRRIRTSDRSVRSRVLYPAELWMQRHTSKNVSKLNLLLLKSCLTTLKVSNGASRRIRTSDRSVRSRVLYPAELWMHIINGGEGGIRTLDTAFDRILP